MSGFRFCFTLDTEPDDLWRDQREPSFESFRRLPGFHDRLISAGARPTYLTTSEVVESSLGRDAMFEILDSGPCEVGAHFHTWTRSWPFDVPKLVDERGAPLHAMAHQLGQGVEQNMLAYTCEALETHLGVKPVSFRGGRWSFGPLTPESLLKCGVRVDSSITPGISWRDERHLWLDGPDFRGESVYPRYLDAGAAGNAGGGGAGALIEIPVGAGYVPQWAESLQQSIVSRKLMGLARRLTRSPLGHVWLRPTSTPLSHMRALLAQLKSREVPVWVFMIHSTEIVPCTKFVTEAECEAFMNRCLGIVRAAAELGAQPATLMEAADWLESSRRLESTSPAPGSAPVR